MSDIAVQVEHLSKMYRLGVINNGTLYRDIQTWFALKRGKEDPHSKIGENKYSGDKDHFWALKDVSFDIQQGDRVGIIGKNGAGKSTLLKILSRITAPTEGTIKIKGKIASLLEVGTGFHSELTGRENIYLNGAILGMKRRRIDEKLNSIIEFSGIEHHIDTPVKRYSSGMFVRLAFAVAAHLDSDILIADEVLAVGDAEFQKKALGKMEDLSTGEGRTVLFVSHNMAAVRQLCLTGIYLKDGKIEYYGLIDNAINLYLNKDIKKSFLFNKIKIPEIDIEIVNITINNSINTIINPFEHFSVELFINSKQSNKYISIFLSINHEQHGIIMSAVSDEDNTMKISDGLQKFTCTFPSLQLAAGDYSLGFGLLFPQHKWYFRDDNILSIKVNEVLFNNSKEMNLMRYSLFYPPYSWHKVQLN